jgi:hypothetical protein
MLEAALRCLSYLVVTPKASRDQAADDTSRPERLAHNQPNCRS